jgi:8-oxo-dGTP pyrophosphatase MutT (NUDIX family)
MGSVVFSANQLKMHPSFEGDGFSYFSSELLEPLIRSMSLELESSSELRQVLRKRESTDRASHPCHLTTSSVVLSPDGLRVLLLLHRKIGEWVYPGGHADGDWHLLRSALRECFEETGLQCVEVMPPRWADGRSDPEHCPHFLTRFRIPAVGGVPEHVHYDCVFVFRAMTAQVIHDPAESLDLAWFSLDDLRRHAARKDGDVRDKLDALTARLCLRAVQSALGD